jgi:hypothetical protein
MACPMPTCSPCTPSAAKACCPIARSCWSRSTKKPRALRRARSGRADRIGGRDPAYHARVAAAFAGFAQADPERFARIPALGTPEAVSARIEDVLARWMPPTC